jgi:hypothetical protein
LEKFNVLKILFNVVTKKGVGKPDGFEGLLKYYVKLTPTRFIEQRVIPELYNELLMEIFSSWVTPLNGKKDVLTSKVCIMEGNGQVSYHFLTTGLKGA